MGVFGTNLDERLDEMAQPLFKDERMFTLMADPKLEGNYPTKGKTVEADDERAEEKTNAMPSGKNIVLEIKKDTQSGAWQRD
ncbi:putative serine/threonine-protein kinase PBL23 [Camellia lanceoleosa]|uniref:Serine/threonine-protein kinase PBL23 n=1 Tax=Camellia lanceoleosa TaxID=1840588 RepID=A0ACC0GII5_9ERIC|nr:putative serine/threonine-protein kinase PBL23 [Camellia lanceoleosa]